MRRRVAASLGKIPTTLVRRLISALGRSRASLDVGRVGLGEDRADHGRDHLLLVLWHLHEHVAHEVDPTALPGEPGEDRLFGFERGIRRVRLSIVK